MGSCTHNLKNVESFPISTKVDGHISVWNEIVFYGSDPRASQRRIVTVGNKDAGTRKLARLGFRVERRREKLARLRSDI